MNLAGLLCQWEWSKVLNVCLNALFVLAVSLCHTSRCWEQKARPHVVSATALRGSKQSSARLNHFTDRIIRAREDYNMCNFYPASPTHPPRFFLSVTFLILFTLWRSSFDRKLVVRYCYGMCGRRGQDKRCHKMSVHRDRIFISREIGVCYLSLLIYSAYCLPPNRGTS